MAQYIDKAAVVAEIERRIERCAKQREDMLNVQCHTLADDASARMGELRCFQDFLDTLEVKEVDLEKKSLTWSDIGTIDQLLWDLSEEWSNKKDNEGYYQEVLKRFKAQKGE